MTAPTHPLDGRRGSVLGLQREAVKDPNDGRKVAYWRYRKPGATTDAGSVKPREDGFRALGYPLDGRPPGPSVNRELGVFDSKQAAELAVARWAGTR